MKTDPDKPVKHYEIKFQGVEKEIEKMIVNYLIEDGKLNEQDEKELRAKMGAP